MLETCVIDKVEFHVFDGSNVTVCCLTLKNGFTTIGWCRPSEPKDYSKEVGEGLAKNNAIDNLYEHELFLLKQREFENG